METKQLVFFDDEKIKYINSIQYLGSKKELLEWIIPLLREVTSEGKVFVDLFAGTGSVGYAMKQNNIVISNDLQKYSAVINSTLIKNKPEFNLDVYNDFEKYYLQNKKYLFSRLKTLIEYENKAFKKQVEFQNYSKWCDETPFRYRKSFNEGYSELINLINEIEDLSGKYGLLFTTYFANSYFGIQQCIEIDSIRYAIKKLDTDDQVKNFYLTALMSTMSYTVSSTTHFAQYLKIKNPKNFEDIISKRKNNIYSSFREKLNNLFSDVYLGLDEKSNIVMNLDFEKALDELNNVTTIYADPPYFKEHYSRYYHVLETLIDYDYPELTFNPKIDEITAGRYPLNRKVSDFGKKSQALKAFEKLVSKSYQLGANLCISYSDNSIVSINKLQEVCETYYSDVFHHNMNYLHSKQGRSQMTEVQEILIICKHPNQNFKGIQDVDSDENIENLVRKINAMEPVVVNPISQMHNYLAKKPYNIISEIISSLTNEGEIVYDGFLGSGTTGYEALKLKRKFIGIDVNIISHNYFKSVTKEADLQIFKELYEKAKKKALSTTKDLYSVICPVCGATAQLERVSFDNETEKLKVDRVKYICRTCSPNRKSGKFIEARIIDQEQYDKIDKIALKYDEFYDIELLENKHIAIQEGAKLGDYFCNRNKIALFVVLSAVEELPDVREKELVRFVLSSALHFFKLSDHKASSQVPYWKPKKNLVSRNPFIFLDEKFEDVYEGIKFAKEVKINDKYLSDIDTLESSVEGAFVIHDSITSENNSIINKGSVSLIITDPPYSEQVPYLEYTGLWDKVFKLDNLSNEQLQKEIVVSKAPSRNKDEVAFNLDMKKAIIEMGRVLKNKGYCCFFYHDFSLSYWKNIIDAAYKAQLHYVTQVHVGSKQKSLKTVWNPNRTLEGSALVFFRKDDSKSFVKSSLDIIEAENLVKISADKIMKELKGQATTQELYDLGILDIVINNDILDILSLKYKTFVQLFKKWYLFDEKEGVWRIENV